MKSKKMFLITLFLSAAPLWVGLAMYRRLPALIPSHWNFAGEVDGYMGKNSMIFGMGGFLAALQFFLCFAVKNDSKNKKMSPVIEGMTWWIIPAVSLVATHSIYNTAMGLPQPAIKIVVIAMSLLFLVIGNYMPKTRQNYTVGIKVPWTLNDESNWEATHRFAGHLWVWCSLICIVLALLGLEKLCVVLFIVMAAVPVIYSYLYYRNHM